MNKLKLNCDLGEKVHDNDELIMPFIDQANIACGLHASDPQTISQTIASAKSHNVEIGAHPSYPDRENFGRLSMTLSRTALQAVLHYQLHAFRGLCELQNSQFTYVKPHGALYNDMMRSTKLFEQVCHSVQQFDSSLAIMIQAIPNVTQHQQIADKYGLRLRFEAFADRNYQDDGLLISRALPNAIIHEETQILNNIKGLISTGALYSTTSKKLPLQVDSLCVHGDNLAAISLVQQLRALIDSHD